MNALTQAYCPRIVPKDMAQYTAQYLRQSDATLEKFRALDVATMRSVFSAYADTALLYHIVREMLDSGTTKTAQGTVADWIKAMWPDDPVIRPEMRIIRFLEEALELGQAMGVQPEKVHELIAQVYAKEPGELGQEIAGAYNTLLGVAESVNVDAGEAALQELNDSWERRDEIRAKSKTKVKP